MAAVSLLACNTDKKSSHEALEWHERQTKQEIREAQAHWMEAAIRKDEPVLRQILGTEYHLIAGRLGFVDKESWLAMGPHYTIEAFEYIESDIHVYGEVAVSNSKYRQKATYKREDRSGVFYLTDIWVKRDGRWKVVTRHSSNAVSP
jgi:ketosteroid isomerase-like protein